MNWKDRIADFYSDMNPGTGYETPEDWVQRLSGIQYVYVYVYNTDEDLLKAFGHLFDQVPAPETLYAVNQGLSYLLTLVQQ